MLAIGFRCINLPLGRVYIQQVYILWTWFNGNWIDGKWSYVFNIGIEGEDRNVQSEFYQLLPKKIVPGCILNFKLVNVIFLFKYICI